MLRLVIIVLLWSAGDARAQDAYRTAIDQALGEYELGNFAEARAQFLRAHELSPSARSLRGLGMAEFELRNYGAAIEHLEAALSCAERPLEESLREQTTDLLARAHGYVAQLTLRVSPEHARLSVDGVQEAARRLVLEVGDHALELRAPGYLTHKRLLKVTGGEQLALEVRLEDGHAPRRWLRSPWLWSASALVLGGIAAAILLTRDPGSRSEAPEGGTTDVALIGPGR